MWQRGPGRKLALHLTRAAQLSCAEALAAALYITGYADEAATVMACFKWGHSFLELNRELLDRYAACQDSAQVVQTQQDWIAMCEDEKRAAKSTEYGADMLNARAANNREMPPSDSDSYE